MDAPTTAQFKTFFSRDFVYGTTSDKVMDTDIERAALESGLNINAYLFDTEEYYQLAYEYLTAHNLVMNLKNSQQGMSGGYSWLENSKSAGSVSQSFSIPEEILKNPALAMLSKTSYGAKYLSLILPLLHGNMLISAGWTQG